MRAGSRVTSQTYLQGKGGARASRSHAEDSQQRGKRLRVRKGLVLVDPFPPTPVLMTVLFKHNKAFDKVLPRPLRFKWPEPRGTGTAIFEASLLLPSLLHDSGGGGEGTSRPCRPRSC